MLQSPTPVHVLEERCGCAAAPSVVSSSHMPTSPQLRLFDTESGALSSGELLVAAGDVNISCWVKSQKQAAVGTLSDCDCCRKFRKWISCGVEEDGSPLSTGRGLAHLIYSWGVLPFHHNFCLSFTHSYFFFFLCAGACEVLGVFGAPLSGQFVR